MKQFIHQIFSEQDGQGSMTRTLMFSVVMSTLCLITIQTFKAGWHLPDRDTLTGLAIFNTSLCGALYGTNQAGDILGSLKGILTKSPKQESNPVIP